MEQSVVGSLKERGGPTLAWLEGTVKMFAVIPGPATEQQWQSLKPDGYLWLVQDAGTEFPW